MSPSQNAIRRCGPECRELTCSTQRQAKIQKRSEILIPRVFPIHCSHGVNRYPFFTSHSYGHRAGSINERHKRHYVLFQNPYSKAEPKLIAGKERSREGIGDDTYPRTTPTALYWISKFIFRPREKRDRPPERREGGPGIGNDNYHIYLQSIKSHPLSDAIKLRISSDQQTAQRTSLPGVGT